MEGKERRLPPPRTICCHKCPSATQEFLLLHLLPPLNKERKDPASLLPPLFPNCMRLSGVCRGQTFHMEAAVEAMMKKMRKVPVEPSPSSSRDCFAQDANKRFRHQSLLQDYMELLKETEAKKRKLEETRQKKLQLLADVRFLRRKYKLLSENPCQETLCRLKKQPHPMTSQSETISRSMKSHVPMTSQPETISRSMKSHVPNELLSLQEKYRLSEAASTSTSVIDSLLINPSQYQYKNKKRKNTPLSLCAEHPLDVFVPREVPSQDWSYGVEDTNARNSLMLEENQVSLMNEEEMEMLELEENYPKMEKLNRFSAEGGYRKKFVISRDVAKNSNKARKRKISWQDQVVLKV